jgi:hypothetical protein
MCPFFTITSNSDENFGVVNGGQALDVPDITPVCDLLAVEAQPFVLIANPKIGTATDSATNSARMIVLRY